MKHFPEHTDIGKGFSWTATFDSHDWGRNFDFYFTVTLYHGRMKITTISVKTPDQMYGDPNCKLSNEEIAKFVWGMLDTAARKEAATIMVGDE